MNRQSFKPFHTEERAGIEPALVRVFTNWLFDSLERIFAEAAPWANPSVGDILECGAGAMPASGSPTSGSYSKPHGQTYFMVAPLI